MYNSKLEVRAEAARLAIALEDVTAETVVSVAKEIEKYIIGDVNLPEVYNPNEASEKMMEFWKTQQPLQQVYGTTEADKEAAAEGQAADGEQD